MAYSEEEIDLLYTQFSVQRVDAMVAEAISLDELEGEDEDLLGVDYSSLKVDELTALLKGRELATDGLKAELVARLEEDDKTQVDGQSA